VRVAVSGEHAEPEPEPEPAPGPGPGAFRGFPGGGDPGDISRITLRLVEQIKSQAEQAAAAQGVSLNSWVAQAVQGALAGGAQRKHTRHDGWRDGPGGRHLRGWVEG
jgi:hypothetical protein